jgi:leader peptidase (prepilin peptidase)/N-methyltransferase
VTAAWTDPAVLVPVTVVVGLIVGSFLNVVVARLPRMMERQWQRECAELLGGDSDKCDAPGERFDLVRPGSQCPGCGAGIRAIDNIPVLSWLLLRGQCRHCGQRISVQYPLVELGAALLALVPVLLLGAGWPALLAVVFGWILLAAAVIDLRTQLLPDDLTLPLLWLGLVAAAAGIGFADPVDAILGAAIGYLLLWGLYHAFRLLTGKEGMGYGDFKLLAALGAWTGWQGLPVIILLSSFVGAAIGIGMIALRGQDRSVPIPFGPFLALGGWIALHWGEALTTAYLQWSLG